MILNFVTITILTNIFSYFCEYILEIFWSWIAVKLGKATLKSFIETDYVEKFLPFRTYSNLFKTPYGFIAILITITLTMSTFISPLVQSTFDNIVIIENGKVQNISVSKSFYYGLKPLTVSKYTSSYNDLSSQLNTIFQLDTPKMSLYKINDCLPNCEDIGFYKYNFTTEYQGVDLYYNINTDVLSCSGLNGKIFDGCFAGGGIMGISSNGSNYDINSINSFSGLDNVTEGSIYGQSTLIATMAIDKLNYIAYGARVSIYMSIEDDSKWQLYEAGINYNVSGLNYKRFTNIDSPCKYMKNKSNNTWNTTIAIGCGGYAYNIIFEKYIIYSNKVNYIINIQQYDRIDGNMISPTNLGIGEYITVSYLTAITNAGRLMGPSSISNESLSKIVLAQPAIPFISLNIDTITTVAISYDIVALFDVPDTTFYVLVFISGIIAISAALCKLIPHTRYFLLPQIAIIEITLNSKIFHGKKKIQYNHEWFNKNNNLGFKINGEVVTLSKQETVYYDATENLIQEKDIN
jgi:hypothetical protein